jgi:ABC-type proline/glycine betaine transport system permease subunit
LMQTMPAFVYLIPAIFFLVLETLQEFLILWFSLHQQYV